MTVLGLMIYPMEKGEWSIQKEMCMKECGSKEKNQVMEFWQKEMEIISKVIGLKIWEKDMGVTFSVQKIK